MIFVCFHCHKTFSSEKRYNTHVAKKICVHNCPNCKHIFSSKQRLTSHKKKCTIAPVSISLQEKVEYLEKKILSLEILLNERVFRPLKLSIRGFGSEIVELEDCQEIKILNSCNLALKKLIELIYINECNRNCYIKNIKTNVSRIFNGRVWKFVDTNYLLESILKINTCRIEDMFENHQESVNPRKIDKFTLFLNELINPLASKPHLKSIKLYLMNHKDIMSEYDVGSNKKNK